ncbi:MAG TPA: hypothetical protein VHL10_05305, partial [Nitrososphaera sp.]|nr:hypothetical protein [Nitrososphaera sp.]
MKKKENVPGQLLTQAAIAYDKAFSKADVTDIATAIPPSLERSIVKALVSDNAHYVSTGRKEPAPASGSEPGPGPVIDQVQAQATDKAQPPATTPGPGLQRDSVAGAGAACQALSPGPEPENISEPEKALVHELVTVQPKPRGPRRFMPPDEYAKTLSVKRPDSGPAN